MEHRISFDEAAEKLKDLIDNADSDTIVTLFEQNFGAVKCANFDYDTDEIVYELEDGCSQDQV
jgi:hypothetical protein